MQRKCSNQMKEALGRVTAVGIVCAMLIGVSQAQSQVQAGPAQELPVPSELSDKLQAIIATGKSVVDFPVPTDNAAWLRLQRDSDEATAVRARALADSLGASVEHEDVGGVKCFVITPKIIDPANARRLLVHVHGGAYVFGAGLAATWEAVVVAHTSRCKVLSVDYRVPPDHPFPAAVDDAVAVWAAVTKEHDAGRVALFGTSTGGGLTMAAVLKMREVGLPLPGALMLGTPWSDLTKTGDSYFTNAGVDATIGRYEGLLASAALLYAGEGDLENPLVSPINGDLAGFPPTILISGTRDLFLSNTVRAHRKLRAAGVRADLHVYEGQSHGHYLLAYPCPESDDAFQEVASFFNEHLKN